MKIGEVHQSQILVDVRLAILGNNLGTPSYPVCKRSQDSPSLFFSLSNTKTKKKRLAVLPTRKTPKNITFKESNLDQRDLDNIKLSLLQVFGTRLLYEC
jgi:hypothetical protein